MELEQYITNQLKAYSNGYGEPEAWLYLKSGRSIEITLEQEGLTEEELFFSVRLHCTEQEFDADLYHSTLGVIDISNTAENNIKELIETVNHVLAGHKEEWFGPEQKEVDLRTMTDEQIFCDLKDELHDVISAGEYGTWEDVCAEMPINDDFRFGYNAIVVWGEENDAGEKFFSVSIRKNYSQDNPGEEIHKVFSESSNYEDLESAVYKALRDVEQKRFLETKKEGSNMSNKENNKIYLIGNEDGSWSASIAEKKPNTDAYEFIGEQTYPVDVFYARTDMNGSAVYEVEKCADRKELVSSLNWIGKCGYSLLGVWDFDSDNEISAEIEAIFEKAVTRRFDKITNEAKKLDLDEIISSAEKKASENQETGNKLELSEHDRRF